MFFSAKNIATWVGLALLYFAAAKLSLLFAFEQDNTTPFWPPTGLSLAGMLLLGPRIWPALFVGSLAVVLSTHAPLHTAVLIAVGNTLEATIAWFIVTRAANPNPILSSTNVLRFVCAISLGALISATLGITALFVGERLHVNAFNVWLTWFIGNFAGAVVFTPLLLAWARGRAFRLGSWDWQELAVLITVSTGLLILLFAPEIHRAFTHSIAAFAFLPLAMWAAYRFQQRGATTYTAIISVIAVFCTTQGLGPFAMSNTTEALLLLQTFIISIAIPALLLAASAREKSVANEKLLQAKSSLEENISRRTADLKKTNQVLFEEIRERKSTIDAMQSLLSSTTISSLPDMLQKCTKDLTVIYTADIAFIGVFADESQQKIKTLAVWIDGKPGDNFEYALAGTPCEDVLNHALELVPDNVATRYPEDHLLAELGIESYFGAPLRDHQEHSIGIIAVLKRQRFDTNSWSHPILSLYTRHIAAAIERQRTDEERKLAESVFASSIQCIAIADREGNILRVNPTFEEVTGYREEEVRGKNFRILKSGRHSKVFYHDYWQALLNKGSWQGEIWNQRKSGELFPVWQTATCVRDDQNEITHFVSIFNDITDKKVSEDHIFHLAHYDSLTGLYNRTAFQKELHTRIERCRQEGSSLAVVYLDLDHFKLINDASGHAVGDLLLREVADRLRFIVREEDVVARLGGDEFVILFSDHTDRENLVTIANKIISELTLPTILNHTEVVITASLGISIFPQDGDNEGTLLTNADTAMYFAKQSGRNSFQFFANSMAQHAQARLTLESEMRKALENHEFILHYQPQMNVVTKEIIGCEALVRWQHPRRGLVSPAEFIPVAEECGLIHPLGAWIIRESCRQLAEWIVKYNTRIKLSINISGRQFRDKNLLPLLSETLNDTQIPPRQLDIELTESVLMENTDEAIALLNTLKRIGVYLSVDDFGTGYSSLAYLKRFPIDRLKIDQSFVRDIATDPDDAAIVNATISLSHNLHLSCVAEGVESLEQIRFLKKNGCIEMQGFYFSKPLTAEKFGELLARGTIEIEE